MDRKDVERIGQWAQLVRVGPRLVPAATIVLHECLSRRGVDCSLEFQRLVMVDRVFAATALACHVPCARTIAGIRLGGVLMNALGRDPWCDAMSHADRRRFYLSWAREEDKGFLGQDSMCRVREGWESLIQAAVDRVLLDENTVQASAAAALGRL